MADPGDRPISARARGRDHRRSRRQRVLAGRAESVCCDAPEVATEENRESREARCRATGSGTRRPADGAAPSISAHGDDRVHARRAPRRHVARHDAIPTSSAATLAK